MNDGCGAGAECFIGNTSRKHHLPMRWLTPPTPIARMRAMDRNGATLLSHWIVSRHQVLAIRRELGGETKNPRQLRKHAVGEPWIYSSIACSSLQGQGSYRSHRADRGAGRLLCLAGCRQSPCDDASASRTRKQYPAHPECGPPVPVPTHS